MKSLKFKMLTSIISIVFIVALVIGTVSSFLSYKSTIETLEKSMTKTVTVAADLVEAELNGCRTSVIGIGMMTKLSDDNITQAEKEKACDYYKNMYGMVDLSIVNINGEVKSNETNEFVNISDRDYFKASIEGKSYVTDPMTNKATGELNVIVSAPLWKDGIYGTSVVGVVVAVFDAKIISDITNKITIGETGSTFAIDNAGFTIADSEYNLVKSRENIIENAKTDEAYLELNSIYEKMLAQETGFQRYNYFGRGLIIAYAPIPNTNGWSLGVEVERLEFTKSIENGIAVTLIIVLASIIISALLALRISIRITKPIISCVDRLKLLAQGDLTTPVPTTKAKDETKELLDATNNTINGLNDIIGDVTNKLDAMANENLDIEVTKTYPGDFQSVEKSLKTIVASFNNLVLQINQSSEQVASGSDQVACGAQALSQGATEQASAIEELSATIYEISEQVKQTAKNAGNANSMAEAVGTEVDDSHKHMKDMVDAITQISVSSSKIGNIIDTIDNIAFQTNILALNAAVEAARAGAAGKGFAVVAEEVRNLASKSAEAAKNTTELIESSIEAVNNGTKIADETAASLESVVTGVNKINVIISNISQATNEQAMSINQITQGVEQISAVVQTNSATAEESAAASEELSGQAQVLNSLISRFKLRDTHTEN